jgi:hypothetical protein
VIDAGWTQRYVGGNALQIRAEPGIYSDFEEMGSEAIGCPVSLAWIRAFNPCFSGIVGVQLRPRFERWVMPIARLEWEATPSFRIEAGVPESRIDYYINRRWSTYLGLAWTDVSYALREVKGLDREQITWEEYEAWLGVTHRVTHQFQFSCEVGQVFERSVEFKKDVRGLDSDIDLEEAVFVRFALGGPF